MENNNDKRSGDVTEDATNASTASEDETRAQSQTSNDGAAINNSPNAVFNATNASTSTPTTATNAPTKQKNISAAERSAAEKRAAEKRAAERSAASSVMMTPAYDSESFEAESSQYKSVNFTLTQAVEETRDKKKSEASQEEQVKPSPSKEPPRTTISIEGQKKIMSIDDLIDKKKGSRKKTMDESVYGTGTVDLTNERETSDEDSSADDADDPRNLIVRASISDNEKIQRSLEDPSDYRRKATIENIIKFTFFTIFSFMICVFPWFFFYREEPDNPPIKFTEFGKVCIWRHDTGILDPLNNCPYSGKMNVDVNRRYCLSWNKTTKQRRFKKLKKFDQEKILKFLSTFDVPTYFDHCLRFYFNEPLQCLTDNGGEKLELTQCVVPPCKFIVQRQCYLEKYESLKLTASMKTVQPDPKKCLHDTGAPTQKCWYNGDINYIETGNHSYKCIDWGTAASLSNEQLGSKLPLYKEVQNNIKTAISLGVMKSSDTFCRNIPGSKMLHYKMPFCFFELKNPKFPKQTHGIYPCIIPICPTEISMNCFHGL